MLLNGGSLEGGTDPEVRASRRWAATRSRVGPLFWRDKPSPDAPGRFVATAGAMASACRLSNGAVDDASARANCSGGHSEHQLPDRSPQSAGGGAGVQPVPSAPDGDAGTYVMREALYGPLVADDRHRRFPPGWLVDASSHRRNRMKPPRVAALLVLALLVAPMADRRPAVRRRYGRQPPRQRRRPPADAAGAGTSTANLAALRYADARDRGGRRAGAWSGDRARRRYATHPITDCATGVGGAGDDAGHHRFRIYSMTHF